MVSLFVYSSTTHNTRSRGVALLRWGIVVAIALQLLSMKMASSRTTSNSNIPLPCFIIRSCHAFQLVPSIKYRYRYRARNNVPEQIHLSMQLYSNNNDKDNSSNNNERIIYEDEEDAKIFAALAQSKLTSSEKTVKTIVDNDDLQSLLTSSSSTTTTSATSNNNDDWDLAWKKEMKKQQKKRPGSDNYYKSDFEIAAIKAANQVTKKTDQLVTNVISKTPSFDFNTMKYDWKIWIGLLLVISFATAAITSIPQPDPPIGSSDSYYI